MPGTPTRMNQSSREMILSTDLNRIGRLAGKDSMDNAAWRGCRFDAYDPETNAFDDLTAAARAGQYVAIPGAICPPSIDGIAGSYDVNLGTGRGAIAGAAATDESEFNLAAWAAQRVTWPVEGQPDATNPRICTICATPADAMSDLQSRNILLDPDTRETSPENVYKTSGPSATISVVVGTAAASPVPPAITAGMLPLFDVWVPATAVDSRDFKCNRRAWRRIEFPGSSQHGIVKGCELRWDPELDADNGMVSLLNRIVIDGELLTFQVGTRDSGFTSVADTLHAPGNAPAGNDAPTYVYLCGGRHTPVAQLMLGTLMPVVMVETTTPPDELGHPTAALAIAAPAVTFARAACCYIGLRYRAANGTTSVVTFTDGDWIHAASIHNFVQPAATADASSYTAIPMPTRPATATAMRVRGVAVGLESGNIHVATLPTADADIMVVGPGSTFLDETVICEAKNNLYYQGTLAGGDSLVIRCTGFNMNLPRLGK